VDTKRWASGVPKEKTSYPSHEHLDGSTYPYPRQGPGDRTLDRGGICAVTGMRVDGVPMYAIGLKATPMVGVAWKIVCTRTKGRMMNDSARAAAMISTIFAVVEGDNPASIEQRARFYRTVPGIHWPDDWDDLDVTEKKRRLDGMDRIGLERQE